MADERKRQNDMLIERIKGVPAQEGEPHDPGNPNVPQSGAVEHPPSKPGVSNE